MKRSYFTLGIIVLIVLVAVITNPRPARQKEIVKDKVEAYIQKSLIHKHEGHNSQWAKFGQAIGETISGEIVKNVVDNIISTDNYILFSTTKLTWGGKTRVIGIGVFGNVIFTKQLDKMFDKGLIYNKKQQMFVK